MLPVLRYSVLRLALFVASLGVLALVGARGLLLLGLAAGVSFALSYVLLWRARNDVSRVIAQKMEARLEAPTSGFARRLREDDAIEDAAVDASAADAAVAESGPESGGAGEGPHR